jgi:hypothetical protein
MSHMKFIHGLYKPAASPEKTTPMKTMKNCVVEYSPVLIS